MKNLDDLNETLFELMSDIKEGKVDVKKAQAITNAANTIIQSVRTQVQGMAKLNGAGIRPKGLIGEAERTEKALPKSADTYDKKNAYGHVYFVLLEAIGQPKWNIEVEDALIEQAFAYYSEK